MPSRFATLWIIFLLSIQSSYSFAADSWFEQFFGSSSPSSTAGKANCGSEAANIQRGIQIFNLMATSAKEVTQGEHGLGFFANRQEFIEDYGDDLKNCQYMIEVIGAEAERRSRDWQSGYRFKFVKQNVDPTIPPVKRDDISMLKWRQQFFDFIGTAAFQDNQTFVALSWGGQTTRANEGAVRVSGCRDSCLKLLQKSMNPPMRMTSGDQAINERRRLMPIFGYAVHNAVTFCSIRMLGEPEVSARNNTTGYQSKILGNSGIRPYIHQVDTLARESKQCVGFYQNMINQRLAQVGRQQRAPASSRECAKRYQANSSLMDMLKGKSWATPIRQNAHWNSENYCDYRKPGRYTGAHYHEGEDIAAPAGTPIHAVHGGVVVRNGKLGTGSGYGIVTCEGGYSRQGYCRGIEVKYFHMPPQCARTPIGTYVSPGQVIGCVGNTGESRGPHLHIEIRFNGILIDPNDVLPRG